MSDRRRIGEEEIRAHVTAADVVRACDQAFRLYGQGILRNPARVCEVVSGPEEDRFRLDMQAEWPGRYRVRKRIEERSDVRTGRLASRQASLLLEDLRAGAAVEFEAGHLTDLRSGAAGALGIRYLARGPVRRVAVIGTGRVGRCLAMAADHLFELEEIAATSRTAERRLAFARQLEGQLRAPLRLAETLAACLDGADAALLAVPTADPILDRSEVSDRLLLAVLAGDRRTRQLDPEVMETVGVLVDHHEQAAASGEFRYASAQGRADRIALTRDPAGRVLDIGDAACGRLTDAGPRPRLAYLTGLAAQDLGAAALVYERICI